MRLIKTLKNSVALLGISLLFLTSCKDETENKLAQNTIKETVDYTAKVYPLLDSENSRWFFFSSANRPFGMVNLNPDTQIGGAWGSGYRYKTDTIKGFSHIHAWQLSGVSVMPVTINENNKQSIYKDFYSKFSHETEQIVPGYHSLELDRYQIKTELTSTKRVGLHQYKFPENSKKGILFNLNTILGPCENINGFLEQNNGKELSGKLVMTPTHRRPKPITVYFKVLLNTEIASLDKDKETGNYLINLKDDQNSVLMKVGISYTSVSNAIANIDKELPNWDFNEIVDDSKTEWNSLLSRIEVKGGSEQDQKRFYTDLWHALQGRRTISDVNGAYPDNTGKEFKIGQLPLGANGKPKFNQYNSDSFWGAQWTLNTLWGLAYPEIVEEFTHSLMQYYKDGGLIPRGPSGGNYTYVMTGASATPFIVSAIQKGIVKDDLEGIYQALKKNHMLNGIMGKAGYEHTTNLGGGLKYYIDNGFVPYPIPEGDFGSHQDGASMTMEYAYQDWTLAQLAKKLNHTEDYEYFMKRSSNYKNVFNKEIGWMSPKNVQGVWKKDYDPYQAENGFIESNGAQSTWFVPHDLKGLALLMGGEKAAVDKLNIQFEKAEKLGFTAGSSHSQEMHPEYSRIPINFGNQPSIQTSFVFNQLNRPDLTQFWTRKVIAKTFSGLAPSTGYNGDEDQGLMGSLNVLLKVGLFQMNGGTEENPEYQIGSPIFDEVTIALNPAYYANSSFKIKTINNSSTNVYVNKITLNGAPIDNYKISQSEVVAGGELLLEMSNKPNK
ncbi:glycoside hydrolase family 92 protein [Cellulophaga sp. HaHaR_3_176]|uniref:GH92 family glycosyl hydrolase n=1 Tax=Cellulophaga sp. HaHaR_3_176 TaxID=1942464 RepID=UPI001C1F9725|nr:GH92 family glycosyl hydrolase [Cellulophaga sp. HaHaR_3_176]QWX82813.1 glycoside hydrolase family 92 protein [Cellulophaga sp. HaHaR_3_176]